MSDTVALSEAKRALLQKYLRGEVARTPSGPPPITRRASNGTTPLSYGQQQMWLLHQLLPQAPVYTECVTIRMPGPLDPAALEQSFNEVIRRHEAWRTSFPTVDGQPVAVIHPPMHFALPVVDLRHLPKDERLSEAVRRASRDVEEPFDLATGPLLRPLLVRLDDQEHWLFLTLHHIIFDGVAIHQIFPSELWTLYEAYRDGLPSPLADPPLQYADFARWQQQWLRDGALDEDMAYWRTQLGGTLPLLQLPTDRPRPAVQTYHGAMHSFALRTGLTEELKALSQTEGVTLYMLLLATLNTLLYRYTGQDDIAVGSATAGRKRAETQRIMGFFVNMLVMRTNLEGNPTFRELLPRVRDVVLGAVAHEDVPFDQLVKELQPERDPSRNPLFQVALTLEPPLPALESGWTLTQMDVDTHTSKFDLTLELDDRPEGRGIIGRIEYNTDLFDAATIARMVEHWLILLDSIVADPDRRLSDLPMLTAAEQHTLLAAWNDTGLDYPRDRCLHQWFEAQVERTPSAVAAICDGQQLTYRALNNKANQLARYLQGLGVGPDMLVGICVERSLEMLVGLLGILKAGGAYVALDPAYPQERLAFILDDAQVRVLLTQQRLFGSLPEYHGRVVCLDTGWERIGQELERNVESAVQAHHLAYLIYTSGSTGKPKGVAIEHRNVGAFLAWAQTVFPADDLAGVLASTSICFDLSIFELFVPLSCGGAAIIVPNALQLPALANADRVTLVNTVPSVMAELLRLGDLPASVRTVNLAGEPLPAALAQQIYRQASVRRLYNLYGPSEDTTYSTFTLVERDSPLAPSIGRPIANTQVYVLDAHRQLAPISVAGELYIGGDGLARGYLNRPELTAERFISNPFSADPSARLYRTGDLARYRTDGDLEYLGRLDTQVKIRGFRIELGEVEAALAQHPGVRQCVVLAREDEQGDKRLVAYLVPAADPAPSGAELRHFLKETLPDFMIPALFVPLAALPLLPNGKVDPRALPAPEHAQPEVQGYLAPRTPEEEILAAIWADVCRLPRVGIYDNFFELGGHSLMATQLVARVREAFKVNLPLNSLFEQPTVAGLAERLPRSGREQGIVAGPRRDGAAPLSYAQQRLWFLDQLMPGTAVYNMPIGLRFEGVLRQAALRQALDELVCRHETLRTTFAMQDGEPVQVIAPSASVNLEVVDLRGLEEWERQGESRRLAREESRRPFDLQHGPLLRASLLQLDQQDHLLLLTLHHIVTDGWSMDVLTEELTALYDAFQAGTAPTLPSLPIQYADYAVWQRDWLQGEVLASQLAYWRQQLAGMPSVLALPTDQPRPPVQRFQGARVRHALPSALSRQLRSLSEREGVTLFMSVLAGFAALLARYSGQEDLVVGSPVANRTRPEVEGLVGFFVNTLVLRTDLSGNPSFRELLGRVREVTLGALAHQDLPFERLVQELAPERDLSQNPLFQVMITVQQLPPALQAGWSVVHLDADPDTAKFDLSLDIEDGLDGMVGSFEYSTDLFDEATIARLAEHWQVLLEGIVAEPDRPLAELPLLTEAERRQLLVEWNDTQMAFPEPSCLHQLFEAQVARTPDAVAAICGEEQITYRALNARANKLAHHLHGLGVGPDVLVGLCVERSLEMLVGLLGILKAGGAYVPLDPSYPPARLAFMLEDSRATILLTQQRLQGLIPAHTATTLCLDAGKESFADESEENPHSGATPDNLIYAVYTSGSTGLPKGVLGAHRATLNRLRWMWETYPFTPGEVCCQKTAMSFLDSVWEVFGPLLQGVPIAIIPDPVLKDPRRFVEALANRGVTRLVLVPSLLRAMLDAAGPVLQSRLPRLKYWVSSGEALSGELAERFIAAMPQAILLNLYGSSEVAADATFYDTRAGGLQPGVPIGRPIANTQIYLLDAHQQLVPVGVPGELHVGGANLARGYLNRPELTEERFIPNPFSAEAGARLYKMGDLARYRADGVIEYLGRVDHQVKVRGFRVELSEIESALAAHRAIRQCVVVARKDTPGDTRLVAYVVPVAEPAPSSSELRRFLKDTLPDYMIPAAFVPLPALPLLPNGKVNQHALPAPSTAREATGEGFVAPELTPHFQLAEIWEELLDVRPIGIRDNFFDLGGHSLLAARMIERIEQVSGKRLPLATLFESATIEHLTDVLLKQEEGVDAAPLVKIQTSGDKTPIFFLHGDLEGGGFYSANLARHLGPDQPFYALNPHGVDGKPVPYTIEAMARSFLREVRSVRPHGPYVLGGFCAAGQVAFEMGQQLVAQGETVELLIIINAGGASVRARLVHAAIRALGKATGLEIEKQVGLFLRLGSYDSYMLEFLRLEGADRIAFARELLSKPIQAAATLSLHMRKRHAAGSPEAAAAWARREELLGRYAWAAIGYHRKPYRGRIALFWPRDDVPEGLRDPSLGWRKVARDPEINFTPGRHLTSITRYVNVLAEQVRASISRAEEAATRQERRNAP